MAQDTRRRPDPDQMPTLFSALMANLGPGRSAEARRFNLEVALGLVGFFTLMALIQLVVLELRGEAPVGYAVATAMMLGLTYFTFSRWRKAGGWSTTRRRP